MLFYHYIGVYINRFYERRIIQRFNCPGSSRFVNAVINKRRRKLHLSRINELQKQQDKKYFIFDEIYALFNTILCIISAVLLSTKAFLWNFFNDVFVKTFESWFYCHSNETYHVAFALKSFQTMFKWFKWGTSPIYVKPIHHQTTSLDEYIKTKRKKDAERQRLHRMRKKEQLNSKDKTKRRETDGERQRFHGRRYA